MTDYFEPGDLADDITVGADGSLWFTIVSNGIGKLAVSGKSTTYIIAPQMLATPNPGGITTGSDGSLWFTERASSSISNIGLDGIVKNRFPLGNSSGPNRIALGVDGDLYFTEDNDTSMTGIISQTGVYRELSLSPNVVSDVVAGPNKALWYATSTGVLRLGIDGEFVAFADPQSVPVESLCAGTDGSIWAISSNSTPPSYYRISPEGKFTSFTFSLAFDDVGIACGKSTIYLAAEVRFGTLPAESARYFQFDYFGNLLSASPDDGQDPPPDPVHIIEGPDQNLYVVHAGSPAEIVRWTPR